MPRKLYLSLALFFGILTAGMLYQYLGQLQKPHLVAMKPLVIAKVNLKAYEILIPAEFDIVQVPEQSYPTGGFTSIQPIIGQTLRIEIPLGTPILAPMLAKNWIALGSRAMAIPANLTNSVGYTLKQGDFVDIIAASNSATAIIAQDIPIIGQSNDASNKAQAYIIQVTPEQSLDITQAEQKGAVQLVLRGVGDIGAFPVEMKGVAGL
ncbi:MAG: Flp pilus assembly protein CpaB [Desulfosporosinus sp.]|nr:Flp pilus assembly protein CpaB [Desulfosporosinus sp.]